MGNTKVNHTWVGLDIKKWAVTAAFWEAKTEGLQDPIQPNLGNLLRPGLKIKNKRASNVAQCEGTGFHSYYLIPKKRRGRNV